MKLLKTVTITLLALQVGAYAQTYNGFSHVSFLNTHGVGQSGFSAGSSSAAFQTAYLQEPGVPAASQDAVSVDWDSNVAFSYRNQNGSFANTYNGIFNNGVDDEMWCIGTRTDGTIADVQLSVAAKPGFTGEWIVYSGNGPDVNVGSSLGSLANVTNGQTATVSGYNLVIDSEGYVQAPTGFTEASMSGIQVGFKYVAVPEPSSTLLIGLASFGFILRRRK